MGIQCTCVCTVYLSAYTYTGRREQEAAVLVVYEYQPRAVEIREHLPHTDRMAVAAHCLPVLH